MAPSVYAPWHRGYSFPARSQFAAAVPRSGRIFCSAHILPSLTLRSPSRQTGVEVDIMSGKFFDGIRKKNHSVRNIAKRSTLTISGGAALAAIALIAGPAHAAPTLTAATAPQEQTAPQSQAQPPA